MYILDNERNVVETSNDEAVAFQSTGNGQVASSTFVSKRLLISTVFLCNQPLFETMVFRGDKVLWSCHCLTWEQAEKMHQKACDLAREGEFDG